MLWHRHDRLQLLSVDGDSQKMYILKILRPVIIYCSTTQSLRDAFKVPKKNAVQYSKEYTLSYMCEGQRYSIGKITNSLNVGEYEGIPTVKFPACANRTPFSRLKVGHLQALY